MSWLSGITGKAEDFLNRLDKSAGDVLHAEEAAGSSPSPLRESTIAEQSSYEQSYGARLGPSQSVPSKLHNMDESSSFVSGHVKSKAKASKAHNATSLSASNNSHKSLKDPGKTKKEEDALFDFLNSSDSADSSKKRRTPVSSRHHSRQSSTSSLAQEKALKHDAAATVAITVESPVTNPRKPSSKSFLYIVLYVQSYT